MHSAEWWAEVLGVVLRERAQRRGAEPLTVAITGSEFLANQHDDAAMMDLIECKVLEAERAAGWARSGPAPKIAFKGR
jgi:hypothetical protein